MYTFEIGAGLELCMQSLPFGMASIQVSQQTQRKCLYPPSYKRESIPHVSHEPLF